MTPYNGEFGYFAAYVRTQRLTENAPYKGLWLVVKTTTNQPHSVK